MTDIPLVALGLTIHEAVMGGLGLAASRTITPILDLIPSAPPIDRRPGVSVVITAKDEARDIEATVRRFVGQTHLDLEVVVVNDRSTDDTGPILDRLVAELGSERLRVIHNAVLPKGWLGKSHACGLGAASARKSWILFADGDVSLDPPDFLARVVDHCEREAIDHLALVPDTRPMTPLKAATVGVFGRLYSLGTLAHEQTADRPRGGGGVGAFNLLRREVYERIGGHGALPLDTGDDFKLGRVVKRWGFRQRLRHGLDTVRCPWHDTAWLLVKGLEKNFFGGFWYSPTLVVVFTVGLLTTVYGPLVWALVAATGACGDVALAWMFLPLVAQFLPMTIEWWTIGRRLGFGASTLIGQYAGAALILFALWNSMFSILRRGGVSWRDSFYSLVELRKHQLP